MLRGAAAFGEVKYDFCELAKKDDIGSFRTFFVLLAEMALVELPLLLVLSLFGDMLSAVGLGARGRCLGFDLLFIGVP